jgi:hypothetical protein
MAAQRSWSLLVVLEQGAPTNPKHGEHRGRTFHYLRAVESNKHRCSVQL